MKAKEEGLYFKDRVRLADRVPLDTPFTLNIEPSSCCNLKCKYCGRSSDEFMNDFDHSPFLMKPESFMRLVDQMKEFPGKIKVARLSGYGEPLMNSHIAEYVKTIKNSGAAEQAVIFTNATKLTHKLSEELVNAGLDRILVSVNGLSDDEFERNTQTLINFESYVEEIKYLHSIKKQLQIDIKIADACLPEGGDGRKKFFEIFGDYCDRISVEGAHILIHGTKSYGVLSDDKETLKLHKYKEFENIELNVCPLPFYTMTVMANGNIDLCSCVAMPLTIPGLNIKTCTLKEVWNGEYRKEVLLKNLKQDYTGVAEICGTCTRKQNFSFPQDSLDDDRDRLIELISER